jgi:glucose-1-phosphate cytidylyltransferase
MSDVTFDIQNNRMEVHHQHAEPWRVTLVDTGETTMTGGRMKRIRDYVADDPAFCFTYGDGLSDVDITQLIAFHQAHGKQATLTAAYPPGRFGALQITHDHHVQFFKEKPEGDGGMINGGFFVLSPSVIDLIAGDATIWERQPVEQLAQAGQLVAWRHEGFWQPMDTLRDKELLESLWHSGKAPWKIWQ